MMFQRTFYAALFACAALVSNAQNESDAFRFAQEGINGSARFNAMGGAFTSLGGDISGISQNPAGTGVYTKSEWSLSMALHSNLSESQFLGNNSLDGKTNFNLPSFAYVASIKEMGGKWRGSALSIFLNRANTFQERYSYQGNGSASSLVDSYVNQLNFAEPKTNWQTLGDDQITPYPFDIYLAWQAYLINYDDQVSEYWGDVGTAPLNQVYTQETSGAKRETGISCGANYDDKLYLGAGLIFSRIIYSKTYSFSESTSDPDSTYFQNYTYSFQESTTGIGVGLNVGAIYRPMNNLRIGASIKSPIRYNLDLEYESSIASTFFDTAYSVLSPSIGEYNYKMRSPFRSNFGIAYLFGKLGLISLDAEMVNYNNTRLINGSDGYRFESENDILKSDLVTSFNLKAGAEFRISPTFSARAGFAFYNNPYSASVDDDASFSVSSIGCGYRTGDFFIDASYQLRLNQTIHYAYDQSIANRAIIDFENHLFTITAGFRF